MEEIMEDSYKDVAVRFAEWIGNNYWILSSNDLWYYKSDGNPSEGRTTSELFDIFLAGEALRLRSVAEERLVNAKVG